MPGRNHGTQAMSLRRRTGVLLLAGLPLLPAACGGSPGGPDTTDAALTAAAAAITPAGARAHVAYLASDALRGRLTPSPELAAAAGYIAGVFQDAGLPPGGDGNGYLQRYPCTGVASSEWPANVIAIRRGSDSRLADEWIVVSAHYDHVGVGLPDARGDSIYNGADDNASGTAALLEVARAVGALTKAPARSIALVAVSGEELGLVGSEYFVEHHPAALGELVADVNLDMLGRNAPSLLYLIGDGYSSLGPAARAVAEKHAELGLTPQPVNDPVYRQSDQFSFALAGVPALFLHAGSHPELHRPSDELGLLDTDKVSRAARLTFYLVHALASDASRPSWTTLGRQAVQALKPFNAGCAARTASTPGSQLAPSAYMLSQ